MLYYCYKPLKQSYDKDLEELDKTFNTGFNGIENM